MNTIKTKDVIAWLRKQPKTRQFNYFDSQKCLFASFAKDTLRRKGQAINCAGSHVTVGHHTYELPARAADIISKLNAEFTVGEALRALTRK